MIALDYRDKRPIYEQVVDKLENLIVCGALESNMKMPSVRSLALELSVNPNTIQRAYAQLEQDGYLYTIVGRGNYVTSENEWKSSKVKSMLKELSALLSRMKELGITKQEIEAVLAESFPPDEKPQAAELLSAAPQDTKPQETKPLDANPKDTEPQDTKLQDSETLNSEPLNTEPLAPALQDRDSLNLNSSDRNDALSGREIRPGRLNLPQGEGGGL